MKGHGSLLKLNSITDCVLTFGDAVFQQISSALTQRSYQAGVADTKSPLAFARLMAALVQLAAIFLHNRTAGYFLQNAALGVTTAHRAGGNL